MVVDLDPFFELVDQDKPFAWRFPCRQQNRMVPAGVGSRDRAGGKSASPIRLKPFQTQGIGEVLTIFFSNLHLIAPRYEPSAVSFQLQKAHFHFPV